MSSSTSPCEPPLASLPADMAHASMSHTSGHLSIPALRDLCKAFHLGTKGQKSELQEQLKRPRRGADSVLAAPKTFPLMTPLPPVSFFVEMA